MLPKRFSAASRIMSQISEPLMRALLRGLLCPRPTQMAAALLQQPLDLHQAAVAFMLGPCRGSEAAACQAWNAPVAVARSATSQRVATDASGDQYF